MIEQKDLRESKLSLHGPRPPIGETETALAAAACLKYLVPQSPASRAIVLFHTNFTPRFSSFASIHWLRTLHSPTMGKAADQWWFWRGFLSAVFYYTSCGPCYAAAYKRKRRREANASKKEREAMQIEQPDLYQHPAPFEVNPYWQEEISLGPGPPPRRNRNRTANSEKTTKSDGGRTLTTAGTQSSNGSSSTSLGQPQDPAQVLGGSQWNRKRYERPDEEYLEIIEEHDQWQENAISPGISGWVVQKPEPAYYSARAPPINDLHPPVVSTLPSKWDDRKWMLAPPPSAAFMQGKKGVTEIKRNRTAMVSREDQSIKSQKAPQRIDEEPNDRLLAPPGISTPRERTDTPVSHLSAEKRRKRRPPPLRTSTSTESDADDSSDDEPPRQLSVPKHRSTGRRVPRPKRRVQTEGAIEDSSADDNFSPTATPPMASPTLTARSDTNITPALSPRLQPITNMKTRHPQQQQRSDVKKIVFADSSFDVLQDLVESHDLLNAQYAEFAARSPYLAAQVKLPRSDSREDFTLVGSGTGTATPAQRHREDVEELWLDEKDVERWGDFRKWSMAF